MSFGFSISDFVTFIEVGAKVTNALKDSRKAAQDHQASKSTLLNLRQSLTNLLIVHRQAESEGFYLNVQECLAIIDEFLRKHAKYDSAFAESRQRHLLKACREKARKIQYAIYSQDDVRKFEATLLPLMWTITLYLWASLLKTILKAQEGNAAILGRISSSLQTLELKLDDSPVTFPSPAQRVCCDSKAGVAFYRQQKAMVLCNDIHATHRFNNAGSQKTCVCNSAQELPQPHHRRRRRRSLEAQMPKSRYDWSIDTVEVEPINKVPPGKDIHETMTSLLHLLVSLCRHLFSFIAHIAEIPTAISWMLPDNIILYDLIGRRHSLPSEYFNNWAILLAMLRTRFEGCPGYESICRGHFSILDAASLDGRIDPKTWDTTVKKRKRFLMLANLTELRMINHSCTRCGKQMQSIRELALFCRSCRLLCRFEHTRTRKVNIRHLLKLSLSYVQDNSLTPVDWRGSRYISHAAAAAQEHRRLAEDLEHLVMQVVFVSKQDSSKSSLAMDVPTDIDADAGYTTHFEKITERIEEQHQRLTGSVGSDHDEDDPEQRNMRFGPESCEDACQVQRREKEELQHFSSVFIQQDHSLHDAAFKADIARMRELICQGYHVNESAGYWGPPLHAAIMSRSRQAVTFLLSAGADPLVCGGALGYPLHASCLTGHAGIFETTLHASLNHRHASRARGQAFQDAVDTSLVSSLTMNYDGPTLILLYVGANPFFKVEDGRSSFSISLSARDRPLIDLFLAEAWGRHLLTDHETLCLHAAAHGVTREDLWSSDAWLASCCRNIMIQNTKMLGDRIAARLSARKKFFFEIEPEWRNLRGPGHVIGPEYLDSLGISREFMGRVQDDGSERFSPTSRIPVPTSITYDTSTSS